MKKYPYVLVLLIMFSACRDSQRVIMESSVNKAETESAQVEKQHPGKQLLERDCYSCHDPKASRAAMIAPPMEAIKRHYIDSSITKEEFTQALIRWVNDPETETKMPGAHKKFGPMPYMPNPDGVITQIADYLYENEIDRPEWFDAHFQEPHRKGKGMRNCNCMIFEDTDSEYSKTGLSLMKAAQTQLGKNLKGAIRDFGIDGAIAFCHTEAVRITDSVSMMKNAIIKRVSDRPRNRDNQANTEELTYIAAFKNDMATANGIQPMVFTEEGEVSFYYPIITNTMCLQCHGTPDQQLRPETLNTLKALYPSDLAIGYKENEVRGMWSIKFDIEN